MTEAHLTALEIDKLAHGALAPAAVQSADAHLAGCVRCREDFEAVCAAREKFSQLVFPRTVAALEARAGRKTLGPWRWAFVLAPALAVVVFVAIPRGRPPEPDFTVKGGATLHVFGRRDGRAFTVQSGDKLRSGDQLRFEVAPAGAHYLLIGSVDGAGHANIYVPFEGKESVAIEPDRAYVSPDSVILDEVPGPERVFAWVSDAPLSASTAEAALTALGKQGPAAIRAESKLPLFALGQTSFLWEKEAP